MNSFSWIKLISVLINLKFQCCNIPSLELPWLPRHLCQFLPWPVETSPRLNPLYFLHWFPYFVLPHTNLCHNYQIYQTICQAKPIKFISKLYTNHNTLLVKHATYQKAECLKTASLSKLDNIVNNNPAFNAECAEQSSKWQGLFHFHNLTCACNHPYNLPQKSISPLQLIVTSLFHPYLFKNCLYNPY